MTAMKQTGAHMQIHDGQAGAGRFGSIDPLLQERYEDVRGRIAAAAKRSGRSASDVMLVAVTKYAEPEQIRGLMNLGHRDFGENRVQHLVQQAAMVEEYLSRHRVLPHAAGERAGSGDAGSLLAAGAARGTGPGGEAPMRWHMIGHLQRNKVKKAVEFCRLIHSVDSLRVAEEIQQVALKREEPVNVLVQVNCSGERSKFGCPVPAALHLADQIDTMTYVRVRGLMTMAPYSDNPEKARPTFVRCRELFEEIRKTGVGDGQFNILSMGMSGDYEVAIAEGANIVRVGSAIFGERTGGEPEIVVEDDR
jgi:PLP dependent protein